MTGYAPLGGDVPLCSFCGQAVPVTVGPSGAICERCATRIAELMSRDGPPPAEAPVDPRDPREPIAIGLDGRPLGDLGNPRADARLLLAIALRDRRVAAWLRERDVDEAAIRAEFGELDLGFESSA